VARRVRPVLEGEASDGDRASPAEVGTSASYLSPDDARRLIARMRRIEGQARGVQRLIEDRHPCHEILTQIEAMRAALHSVKVMLGGCHVRHLVRETFPDRPQEAERIAAEVRRALDRI
jgi:DNA-binding FrmR family transcriptional regulator